MNDDISSHNFRLYIAGCDPAVNNLYPSVKYPVPRGTPSIAPYCTWFYGDSDKIESIKTKYFVSYLYKMDE